MSELVTSLKGWKSMLFDVKGWVSAVLVFGICFTSYQSLHSPITVRQTAVETNVAYLGNYYKLCRDVEYARSTALTLDRAFIKNTTSGDIYTISLAPLTVVRSKGNYSVCRYILIPDKIETGEWEIKTYATYKYFMWQHTLELESIPVDIRESVTGL